MHLDMRDKAAVEQRLWSEVKDARFGMLGARESAVASFAPMTGYPEAEAGKIWFFTRRETHLATAAETGVGATFIVLSADQAFQTAINGELLRSDDDLHRDKFWGATVSAWFPKGKADPNLALLCLTCAEADVWVSEAGGVKFGWEMARANLTGSVPDIGGQAHLTLTGT
jgi:general stress protein 26